MSAQGTSLEKGESNTIFEEKIIKHSNENALIEKYVSVKNAEKFSLNNNSAVNNASERSMPFDTMRINTDIQKARVSDNLFDASEKSKEIQLVEQ